MNLRIIIILLIVKNLYATNYYVSSNGNDSFSGTSTSQAWRSLNRVNNFQDSLLAGDRVLFERGGVFRGSIHINKSGEDISNPIFYGAYGEGPKPLFLGSEPISNWTNLGNDIWTKNVGFLVEELFIENKRQTPARYPNKGYLTIESSNGTTSITNALISNNSWTGATIVVRQLNDYIPRGIVTSQSENTLTIDIPGATSLPVGNGFYLHHSIEALDMAGEWYQNPNTTLITLKMPPGKNPNLLDIEGSVLENGIFSDYYNYLHISDIQFKNYKKDGISITSTRGTVIEKCSFSNILERGIELRGEWTDDIKSSLSTDCKIDSCTFFDIQSEALCIAFLKNVTVTRNFVKRISLSPGYEIDVMNAGFGMIINQVYGTNISLNKIDSTGYSSLSWGGEKNSIFNNEFSNNGLSKNDNGFMQTWGGFTQNNIVFDNILHDGYGNEEGMGNASTTYFLGSSKRGATEGIYFDDFTSNNTVSGNTIYNSNKGIFIQSSRNFLINDNTIYNCDGVGIFLNEKNLDEPYSESSQGWTRDINNITLTKNKIYSVRASNKLNHIGMVWSSYNCNSLLNFGVSDNNYFFNPYKNGTIGKNIGGCGNGDINTIYNLDWWNSSSNQDANSKTNSFQWSEYNISTIGIDLISNGVFDSNIEGWNSYGNGSINWEVNNSLKGGTLKISQSSNSSFEIQSPALGIEAGKLYVVKFSAIANKNLNLNPIIVSKYPNYGYVFDAGNYILNSQKNDFQFVFTAPSPLIPNAEYGLHFYTQSEGDIIWIDNLSIYEVSAIAEDDFLNKSKLFVNNQPLEQHFSLGANTYIDLDGNEVIGKITIKPFKSKILILKNKAIENLDLSTNNFQLDASNTIRSLSIFSNMYWHFDGVPSWISLSSSTGFGNKTIDISVLQNLTTEFRNAQITISGGSLKRIITVSQSNQNYDSCSLSPFITSNIDILDFTSNPTFVVATVSSNINFNIIADANWFQVSTISGKIDSCQFSILLNVSLVPNVEIANNNIILLKSDTLERKLFVKTNIISPINYAYFDSESDIVFFPNPVNIGDALYFSQETDFELYDILGDKLFNIKKAKSFDSGKLNAGIYFIKFGKTISKLIVL